MSKTPIEALLDEVEYYDVDPPKDADGLPYVTHEGFLKIGGIEIQVVVLNTGQRIIPKTELERLFGEDFEDLLNDLNRCKEY